jgi:hypothetical protein
MKLYTGIDLHSSNSYLGIIDETGKRVFKRKLPNDPAAILETLAPYNNDIVGIVVESTYNWYWLVDLLNGLRPPLVLSSSPIRRKECCLPCSLSTSALWEKFQFGAQYLHLR